MPEDVSHEPAIYSNLKNLQTPVIPLPSEYNFAVSPTETSEQYFKTVERVMGKVMGEVKREYDGKLPENQIEMIGDFFFAPFRLDKESLEGTKDESQKELSARIQHTLAHNILYASSPQADVEFSTTVYETVEFYEKLVKTSLGKYEHLKEFWNGVKSEVAVIRMLQDLGYKVMLPDYIQDPWEVNEQDNEVLQWDVRNGVDIIAEDGGKLLLIDCKGSKFIKNNNNSLLVERSLVELIPGNSYLTRNKNQLHLLPKSLQNSINELVPTDVRRLTIIVPTSGKYLQSLMPTASHREGGKNELKLFATLIDPKTRANFSERLLIAA